MGVDHDHAACSRTDNHNATKRLATIDDDEVIITKSRTTRNRKHKKFESYVEDEEEAEIAVPPKKRKKSTKKENEEKRAKRLVRRQPLCLSQLLKLWPHLVSAQNSPLPMQNSSNALPLNACLFLIAGQLAQTKRQNRL